MEVLIRTDNVLIEACDDNGEAIGWAALMPYDDGYFLHKLMVLNEKRGCGAGTAIVKKALELAAGKKVYLFPQAYLDKPLSTPQLVAWYGRMGFVPCDQNMMVHCGGV